MTAGFGTVSVELIPLALVVAVSPLSIILAVRRIAVSARSTSYTPTPRRAC